MLTMLAKEIQANPGPAARPVILALVSECRDRLDVMAAQNEAAFVAAAHALHAEIGASVPAGAQQATAGSEPVDSERDAESGGPRRKKAKTQAAAAEDKLPSLYAKQAVSSESPATRFLFATLALAVIDPRATGSTGVGSTVRQQLQLALSHGMPPAIGEALGEVLLAVCSTASSDLSRSCRRILLQAATRQVGLGGFLSSALDHSKGDLTPVPYVPEPAAQCKPGLVFAARVDVAGLTAGRDADCLGAVCVVGGCGEAVVGIAKRDEGEAKEHVPDARWLSIKVDRLPAGCRLPAVGCVVREQDAAVFLAAPVSEWKSISETPRDGKGHVAASWQEVSELKKYPPYNVMLSMAPGVRLLLLHAQRA